MESLLGEFEFKCEKKVIYDFNLIPKYPIIIGYEYFYSINGKQCSKKFHDIMISILTNILQLNE